MDILGTAYQPDGLGRCKCNPLCFFSLCFLDIYFIIQAGPGIIANITIDPDQVISPIFRISRPYDGISGILTNDLYIIAAYQSEHFHLFPLDTCDVASHITVMGFRNPECQFIGHFFASFAFS